MNNYREAAAKPGYVYYSYEARLAKRKTSLSLIVALAVVAGVLALRLLLASTSSDWLAGIALAFLVIVRIAAIVAAGIDERRDLQNQTFVTLDDAPATTRR